MTVFDLLELVADGEYHSDTELRAALALTSGDLAARVGELRGMGVAVDVRAGEGLRLAEPVELLSEERVLAALAPAQRSHLAELAVLGRVDSTNAELQRRGAPAQGVAVCTAEQQTAGRGRRGRSWVSPPASSIYLSLARRVPGGAEDLEGLSLAVGVSLCEALTARGVRGLALKWPNDVLLAKRKLAGILVEMSVDRKGSCSAVIGIGVNVSLPPASREQIDQPWADLHSALGARPSRNALIGELLERLLPLFADYEQQRFRPWHARWLALDAYADRPVLISSGERRVTGIARGVDLRGALRLETDLGVTTVHGGEVSLRPDP